MQRAFVTKFNFIKILLFVSRAKISRLKIASASKSATLLHFLVLALMQLMSHVKRARDSRLDTVFFLALCFIVVSVASEGKCLIFIEVDTCECDINPSSIKGRGDLATIYGSDAVSQYLTDCVRRGGTRCAFLIEKLLYLFEKKSWKRLNSSQFFFLGLLMVTNNVTENL